MFPPRRTDACHQVCLDSQGCFGVDARRVAESNQQSMRSNFRHFFFRGLTILLPSILTIWLLIAAYDFVQTNIAQPINRGTRELIVQAMPWPRVMASQIEAHKQVIRANPERLAAWEDAGGEANQYWLRRDTRRELIRQWWNKYRVVLDLFGLLAAILVIYFVGAVVGSFIGRRLIDRGEKLLKKVPLVGQVYPSVKQVTEFFFGSEKEKRLRFNRVVAVEYPRKGLWSIGLVTGDTLRSIQEQSGGECVTIFVPSSPTPFTGYVITALVKDTIALSATIEEALRFTISGGVIVPEAERLAELDDTAGGQGTAGGVSG